MDKVSFFKLSGLPDSFGVVLLIFAFILLLSPYFSGGDFGVFKIPTITQAAKKWLRVIGPILFILCAMSFLPVFPTTTTRSTNNANGNTSSTTFLANATGAQNLGATWFAAMQRRDLTVLTQIADFPFYLDNQILAGPDDIRKRFQNWSSNPRPNRENIVLKSIKAKTIAEWKKGGFDVEHDRLLNSIIYNDDDYLVILTLGDAQHGEGVVLYMRKVGGEIKLAGWWD